MSTHRDSNGHQRSIDAELTGFRTTWLRAVALAWSNESYVRRLSEKPKEVLSELGSPWPWEGHIDFKVDTEKKLQWAGDDWVWPRDEEDMLTIYLPLQSREPEERAIALAAYYDQFPSIFGIASGGGGTPRGMSLITSASLDIGPVGHPGPSIAEFLSSTSPVRFAGRNPPPGGFMPSGGSFLDFQVVLLSAMAKAWDSKSFADLLREDGPTAVAALGTIRGFVPQWRLLLQIKDDVEATFKGGKWTVKKHVLTLNLPQVPEDHDQGVALAAYNSTGAEYPFTCCA